MRSRLFSLSASVPASVMRKKNYYTGWIQFHLHVAMNTRNQKWKNKHPMTQKSIQYDRLSHLSSTKLAINFIFGLLTFKWMIELWTRTPFSLFLSNPVLKYIMYMWIVKYLLLTSRTDIHWALNLFIYFLSSQRMARLFHMNISTCIFRYAQAETVKWDTKAVPQYVYKKWSRCWEMGMDDVGVRSQWKGSGKVAGNWQINGR